MAFSILDWALGTTLNAALRAVLNRSWHQRLDAELGDAVREWLRTLPENATLAPSVFFFPRADDTHEGVAEIRQRIMEERRLPTETEWYEALWQHRDYLISMYGIESLQGFFQQCDDILRRQLADLANRLYIRCQDFPELFNAEVVRRLKGLCEELEASDPKRMLLRTRSWIGRGLRIGIQIERVARHREIVARGPAVRSFTLGDSIRLTIEAQRNVNVCLFDIGTSGRITVLLPNRFMRSGIVPEGGRLVLPEERASHPDLELVGVSGVECLIALGATATMPVGDLIDVEQAFLIDPDPSFVRKFVEQFASLREEERGVGYVQFLVVPA